MLINHTFFLADNKKTNNKLADWNCLISFASFWGRSWLMVRIVQTNLWKEAFEGERRRLRTERDLLLLSCEVEGLIPPVNYNIAFDRHLRGDLPFKSTEERSRTTIVKINCLTGVGAAFVFCSMWSSQEPSGFVIFFPAPSLK